MPVVGGARRKNKCENMAEVGFFYGAVLNISTFSYRTVSVKRAEL